jgi:hypothetical protein
MRAPRGIQGRSSARFHLKAKGGIRLTPESRLASSSQPDVENDRPGRTLISKSVGGKDDDILN